MSIAARRFAPCLLLASLALAACGTTRQGPSYITGSAELECVPFARDTSGIRLGGDAASWWQQASGRYQRSLTPEAGGVLVFRASERLPVGHVAVVTQVVDRREIRVSQANWVHHHISRNEPVIDVSPRNDWSEVRVWWSPAGQMGGGIYPTFGFILPRRPAYAAGD